MKSVDGNKENLLWEITLKKILLSISLLLLISDLGYAATRRIYINFDNRPAVNSSTGAITPDTAPSQGIIRMVYWAGNALPSVLGSQHQYITGRNGSGYALSGLINPSTKVGTWPYIDWYGVNANVTWSNEIYVSFWMKYDSLIVSNAYKDYENIKMFYWSFGGENNSLSGELAVGNSPEGSPPSYNEYTYSWRGKEPFLENYVHGYPTVNDADGNWHHYEFYIQRTAGRARWWVDGIQKIDWNSGDSADFLLNGDPYIKWIHIAGSLIGTSPNSKGTRVFDDIEVWDGWPDSASYISTPPPIIANVPYPPSNLSIK